MEIAQNDFESFHGSLIPAGNSEEINVEMKLNCNCIRIQQLQTNSEDPFDIIIPYNSLVCFAYNVEEGFLHLSYTFEEEEDDHQAKISFTDKNTAQLIYNKIQEFNSQYPNEEYDGEPAGNNELFTANSFK